MNIPSERDSMAALRLLDVELEAVTPLWIGGADSQAELRPPSMRGCLRFWFRALAGGLLGESLADVQSAESAVYGR
jgi:CRISPR-associated protein Cmr1